MKGFGDKYKKHKGKESNSSAKVTNDQILKHALKEHLNGNLSEAAKYYEILINQGFNDPRIFSNYAAIFQQEGKIDKAIEFYKKSIELFPKRPEAYSNLGLILKNQGNLNEAELLLKQAIEIKPNFANALMNLGSLYGTMGKLEEARISLCKAIESNPYSAESYYNLGTVLRDLREFDEAEKITRKSLALKPNYEPALANLSLLLYANDKKEEALNSIQKALLVKPNSIENNLIISVLQSESSILDNTDFYAKKPDNRIISNYFIKKRDVEPSLIKLLYRVKALDLNKINEPTYGYARGSDYKFFDDHATSTRLVKNDLINIAKSVTNSNVFIFDSFFTILSGNSYIEKHNHITPIDNVPGLCLGKKKFSLVYYLSVGDQNCKSPGMLKFHEPNDEILPFNGMVIIFPANRYHSVVYNGMKDRVIIGVNFYKI